MGGDAPMVPKEKSKNVDSRLKILGMTEESKSSITPKKQWMQTNVKKSTKTEK